MASDGAGPYSDGEGCISEGRLPTNLCIPVTTINGQATVWGHISECGAILVAEVQCCGGELVVELNDPLGIAGGYSFSGGQ